MNKGNIEYLKQNGVNLTKALEVLGDMEMYNETIEIFYDSNLERLPKIEMYKNNKDMSNYAIEAHALKSDLKYIGFYDLAEIPYQHELESKANNIFFIDNNYHKLIEVINKVMAICKEYLGK